MKEIPVIMTIGKGRPELTDQALKSLYENTKYPHRFYIQGSTMSLHEHLDIRNAVIKGLGNDWEYFVTVDDDLYFTKGWLKNLIETHEKYPDIDVLEATNHWRGAVDVLEDRGDVVTVKRLCGPCCSIRKKVTDAFGGIPVRRLWTRGITEKLKGGVFARLVDDTTVVHCGITNASGGKYKGGMGDYFLSQKRIT